MIREVIDEKKCERVIIVNGTPVVREGLCKKYVLCNTKIDIIDEGVFSGNNFILLNSAVPPTVIQITPKRKAYLVDSFNLGYDKNDKIVLEYAVVIEGIMFTANVKILIQKFLQRDNNLSHIIHSKLKNKIFRAAGLIWDKRTDKITGNGIIKNGKIYKVTLDNNGIILEEHDSNYNSKTVRWIVRFDDDFEATSFMRNDFREYTYKPRDIKFEVYIDNYNIEKPIQFVRLFSEKLPDKYLDDIVSTIKNTPILSVKKIIKVEKITKPWTNYEGDYVELLFDLLNRKTFVGMYIAHPKRDTIITPRGYISGITRETARRIEKIIKYMLGGQVDDISPETYFTIKDTQISYSTSYPPKIQKIGKTIVINQNGQTITPSGVYIKKNMNSVHLRMTSKTISVSYNWYVDEYTLKKLKNGEKVNTVFGLRQATKRTITFKNDIIEVNDPVKEFTTTYTMTPDGLVINAPFIEGVYRIIVPYDGSVDPISIKSIKDYPKELVLNALFEMNMEASGNIKLYSYVFEELREFGVTTSEGKFILTIADDGKKKIRVELGDKMVEITPRNDAVIMPVLRVPDMKTKYTIVAAFI